MPLFSQATLSALMSSTQPANLNPNTNSVLSSPQDDDDLVEIVSDPESKSEAGNLTALLKNIGENQKALIEQQRLANEQQRLANEQQFLLLQQQKIHNAYLIRQELRATSQYLWRPLPPLNGDPFPRDIPFPGSISALVLMKESDLDKILEVYGLTHQGLLLEPDNPYGSVDMKRKVIREFIQGNTLGWWPS